MIWLLTGVLFLVFCLFAMWLVLAWVSIHPPRAPLFLSPYDMDLPYEDVRFPSRDGLMLSGWWLPHPQPLGVVIVCHGYLVNRCEVIGVAGTLQRAGFSCLVFDFRALGKSPGNTCTIGASEVQDALGAVDFVAQYDLPIAIFGSSMGGAVAIMTGARDQRIGAVATDCAYATLARAADEWWIGGLGPILGNLCRPAKYVAAFLAKVPIYDISPLDEITKISPRPVLLLHGERDTIIPVAHVRALFEAAGEPRTQWVAPGSQHVQARADYPIEYYRELVGFLHQWIGHDVKNG
ncbi:MAG: alpha/beta hydrolase [Abitibacteriaceae bacterium]|nr:alpha/beta hydrolase [Abditibacteriaceae bacterium]MBV9867306.1 alpha/beta hydrolase [Abditibacteriaceae bacterium]